MSELRANPEVIYGAAIAFLIVVLLTPAVGGMARLLGRRQAGRAAPQPAADPASRRSRDLPRHPRPVARVSGPLERDARGHPRRRGRLRRRCDRRLPRARAGAEARGPGARGAIDRVRRLDRPLHVPVRRRGRRAGVDRRSAHDHLDRRRDEHGQLPRRPGRPRRRRLRDLGHDVRHRALAREGRRRRPLGRRRRRVRRLPASQLLPGPDLHGRRARSCSASRSRPSRLPGS